MHEVSDMTDIDDITHKLQQEIMDEVKQKYPQKVIDNWRHPKNWGIMNQADGYARITGSCGDTMEISLKVKDKKIERCTYDTDGCGATIACGSIITEMAIGKTVTQARKIDQQHVLRTCGGLPDEHRHCALLAANTLQAAIRHFEENKNVSWKKLYRTV
jgi:nitrogen fixation NifU-like protein